MDANSTAPFSEPASVAGYAAKTGHLVPGLAGLHQMTGVLIAESAPADARVLVVGAGGGMEIEALAAGHPGWRFEGVDPSAEMLALAASHLGPLAERVSFHEGYVDTAPDGPFDAATALLVLHFLPREVRLQTLRDIHRRLKPGAPLVVAHHSYPNEPHLQRKWLRRFVDYSEASGVRVGNADATIATMQRSLPALPPEEEEALLAMVGFRDVELFYTGFTFRGWVATRP